MFKLSRDKGLYETMFRLMIPICLQNVLFMMLNMCDTMMLGMLEKDAEIAINAAGLGNQPFFIYSLFVFGIVSGSSVLISQYWGAGDRKAINKIAGIALSIAVTIGTVVTVVLLFFSDSVLGIFSNDKDVIVRGAEYLRIVAISYLPASMTSMLNGIMRSMEKVKVALLSNFVGIGTNIILNYVLIFGMLGFPQMGLVGAAVATLIARILESTIVLVYVFIIEKEINLKPVPIFKCDMATINHTVKISLPVVINETVWSTGVTVYSIVIGNMGVVEYAAYSVAYIIERVGMVLSQGMASVAAIIIGKAVGSGRKDEAYEYSGTMLFMTTFIGAVMCILIIALRGMFVNIFNVDDITKGYAMDIMFFIGIVVLCKSYNMVSIVGVLRGGGDTRFAMFSDVLPMWLVSLPLGYLLANNTEVSVQYVYFALLFPDEFIKLILGLIRFKSKKWIKNITEM